MIKEDYLRIEYDYRLPLLVFSEKGWQIEKETFAQELYQRMCLDVEEKKARVIFEMKEVNRQVVMCVLDKIEKDGTCLLYTSWHELNLLTLISVTRLELVKSIKFAIVSDVTKAVMTHSVHPYICLLYTSRCV